MSFNGPFADFIRQLPQPELPLAGAKAYLLSSPQGQAAFTLGGEVRICKKGDTYNIAKGEEHGIKVLKDLLAIDIFQDPDRYQAKG
jgi:hypothetical protein